MTTAGPPTPPPTGASEILDDARSSEPVVPAPAPAPAPAAPSQAPPPPTSGPVDAYTRVFPVLVAAADDQDWQGLIHEAEMGDLNAEGDRAPARLALTAPLVLAYLIVDDLPPAHHALTRLSPNLAHHPLAGALRALLAAVWTRAHASVYARAQDLGRLLARSEGSVPVPGAKELLERLTGVFLDAFRNTVLRTLAKAYTALPLPLAETYLGLPAKNIVQVTTQQHGWTHDAPANLLHPAPPSASAQFSSPSSLDTFHGIADTAARLEVV